MTGDIESQYPYWLSKRLNNVYDVINKGFGSDRTYNVLARFKADVLDLNPQYCIIQAGTNDIYWGQAEADGDYDKFDKTIESMKNRQFYKFFLFLTLGISEADYLALHG